MPRTLPSPRPIRGVSDSVLEPPTRPVHLTPPSGRIAVEAPITPTVPGYLILHRVGEGGMGVVYKARHLGLDRVVALKTLARHAVSDPESHDRFRREAEAVARLQHPNIIQVFDVGTFDSPGTGHYSQPFISFEFVDGGTLSRYTYCPQPPRWCAATVETLARALHAAHRVGVVHRDMKPGNVLLTAGGQLKVADFGLAKHLDSARDAAGRFATQDGTVVGTPDYMAPEQVDRVEVTPAIDIHALGVMLYELLTGRVPYKADTVAETMLLVKLQEPVPPRRLQPGLPRDLETICLKCLAKSAAQRYATAGDLADDLASFLDGKSIKARPESSVRKAARWARRNPTVAGLTAMIAVVLVAAATAVVWKWREAEGNLHKANVEAAAREEATKKELWERYQANVVNAGNAVRSNNVNAASRALKNCPEKLRDWEWGHFNGRLDRSERTIRLSERLLNSAQHGNQDAFLVTLEDGSLETWDLVTQQRAARRTPEDGNEGWQVSHHRQYSTRVRQDHVVEVMETVTGRRLPSLVGHTDAVVWRFFPVNSSVVVTSSEDKTARVWDRETGRPISVYRGHDGLVAILGVTEDGRTVVTRAWLGREIHVWDAATGRLRHRLKHDNDVNGVEINATGDRILTVEVHPSNLMKLWDGETGKLVAEQRGHENSVTLAVFSRDGKNLVTCSRDQTARLWDGRTCERKGTLTGHAGWVHTAAFNATGDRLATAAQDLTIRLWDVNSASERAVLCGHTSHVTTIGFTPDGSRLASASDDGTLRFWDVAALERDGVLRGHKSFVYGLAWHPDGKRVASGSWDGTILIRDASTGETRQTLRLPQNAHVTSVAFHPSGDLLASLSRDSRTRLWDLNTGAVVAEWEVPKLDWRDTRIVFSPDGRRMATGNPDGRVRIYDVASRTQEREIVSNVDGVRDVAFSPDGRWIAAAGEDVTRTIRVWDVESGTEVATLSGHKSRLFTIAFSPDGRRIASGSEDGTVRLWDVATWSQCGELKVGANVYGLAFTPDGSRLAACSVDKAIHLFEVEKQQEVVELWGHTDYVYRVAFSPDGRRLASSSGDNTVRIWEGGK